jgi:hypothetical protein
VAPDARSRHRLTEHRHAAIINPAAARPTVPGLGTGVIWSTSPALVSTYNVQLAKLVLAKPQRHPAADRGKPTVVDADPQLADPRDRRDLAKRDGPERHSAASPSACQRLRTSNGLEPPEKEIKRHNLVAALCPNEASMPRLISAVLSEISHDWETDRPYLNMKQDAPAAQSGFYNRGVASSCDLARSLSKQPSNLIQSQCDETPCSWSLLLPNFTLVEGNHAVVKTNSKGLLRDQVRRYRSTGV